MELSIYDIIKGPVISDKAYKLNKQLNKLVLKVHVHANKPMIKQALEKLFNVKIDKVNTARRKGKNYIVKKVQYTKPETKIVIVTLAEGHSLNLFEQAETTNIAAAGQDRAAGIKA